MEDIGRVERSVGFDLPAPTLAVPRVDRRQGEAAARDELSRAPNIEARIELLRAEADAALEWDLGGNVLDLVNVRDVEPDEVWLCTEPLEDIVSGRRAAYQTKMRERSPGQELAEHLPVDAGLTVDLEPRDPW